AVAAIAAVTTLRRLGPRRLRLRAALGRLAAAVALAGLRRLVVAHALHHLAARALGGGVHDFARRHLAGAAPQHLAAHGDGMRLFTGVRTEPLDHLGFDLLLG